MSLFLLSFGGCAKERGPQRARFWPAGVQERTRPSAAEGPLRHIVLQRRREAFSPVARLPFVLLVEELAFRPAAVGALLGKRFSPGGLVNIGSGRTAESHRSTSLSEPCFEKTRNLGRPAWDCSVTSRLPAEGIFGLRRAISPSPHDLLESWSYAVKVPQIFDVKELTSKI